jgi:hypothetical protein
MNRSRHRAQVAGFFFARATGEKKRMCSFAHAFDRGLRRVLRIRISA